MPVQVLKALLNREQLRRLAGDAVFERGERYAHLGCVGDVAEDGGQITAFVTGTDWYRSDIRVLGSKLRCTCTCPAGAESACCKHAVAVGLIWLDSQLRPAAVSRRRSDTTATRATRSADSRPRTMKDVRSHLAALPANALVELVMQQAMTDERLRQRLLLDCVKGSGGSAKLHGFRRALTAAIGTGDFVHYREASSYFEQILDVISSIDELVRKEPAAVLELTEHALTLLEQALGHIDDSDGSAAEVLERLYSLHLDACRRECPAPEVLAQRLFEWEMRSDRELFFGAVSRYADLLGKAGMARYRALADREWRKVPALGAGQVRRSFSGTRFRITSIMETLAGLRGDVDAIVEVKARDLSSASAYLTIAELYQEAGRTGDALHWAERGVAALPAKTDSRLREFLAMLYSRTQRIPEALSLLWLNFVDRPSLMYYRAMHTAAEPVGTWPEWRERAIATVRAPLDKRAAVPPRSLAAYGVDGSLLVEILLWEGDAAGAWIAATEFRCSEQLWIQLAKRRETSHPNDAVAVYQATVERALSRVNNGAYHEAVALLRVIARVMKRSTVAGGMPAYLTALRNKHKAKRNFMRLLDAAKL
jgi:uncharacterized Zn finger protein